MVHASNFRKVKRVEDVVHIFAEINQHIPSKLLMVGDGPERHECEELARQLNVADDVRFVGKQEQIEEILAVSDLFILPSEYESFGLAALEAMAARSVVITTNAGGLPEIIIQNKTGFMANIGDIKLMSEFAIKILGNEDELTAMKEAAYRHSLNFNIKNIIPQYENIYKRYCRMDSCR